jgi:hypothetical protein
MSLVVYRDGRLYADTKAWGGEASLPSPGSKNKIVYADDGAMIGVTSASLGEAKSVLAAYNDGSSTVDDGAFTALIVKPGIPGYFYWLDDHEMLGPFDEPYFAVGSGAKYALGALEVGAPIADVFRAAAKHDYFTDSVFRTFDLVQKPARKRAKTTQ